MGRISTRPADRHGPFLDGVHAEDAALGRIEDRRGEERAEDAAVGDGEDAAFESGSVILPSRAFLA
jgi:hypothetical protein